MGEAETSLGEPLPPDLQQRFGLRLGVDLRGVRIHTGEASARAAEAVDARAYTTGRDIHFARGGYDPSSREGQRWLAHEVVHTVQQGPGERGYQDRLEVSQPGDPAEREADAVADHIVDGDAVTARVRQSGAQPRPIQREEGATEDPLLDPLIRGELADAGRGIDLGYTFAFFNKTVDAAFQRLCAKWGLPLFPNTGGDAGAGKERAGSTPPPSGHSSGRDVAQLPSWFNQMQNKLIASSKWGKEEKATQALLEVFLAANYPKAPASVMSFFHHVGKSATNEASNEMVFGSVKGKDWCQQASTTGLLNGLKAHGLRFKARIAPRSMDFVMPPIKAGERVPAWRQDALYAFWIADAPPVQQRAAGQGNRTISGKEAWTAPLEPGDIVSLLTSTTPPTGHVATVLKFSDPILTIVSGNAAGKSVRIEDVRRGEPEQGKTQPSVPDVAWIISIQKAGKLDPAVLANLDDDALANLGLEKGPVEPEKPLSP